ncbi:MAG: hypothetical protein ABI458_01250, partial [Chloroflexota bacterium]
RRICVRRRAFGIGLRRLSKETDGPRAEALLLLSFASLGWLHAGLALLIVAGVAAGFPGAVVGSGLDLAVA